MICLLGKAHLKHGRLASSSTITTKVLREKRHLTLCCSAAVVLRQMVHDYCRNLQVRTTVRIPSFLRPPLSDWSSKWGWALCQINTTANMTTTLHLAQRHMHWWHGWSPEREIQCAIMWRTEYKVYSPWWIQMCCACPWVACSNSSDNISNPNTDRYDTSTSVTRLSDMYSTSLYQHTAGLTMTEWISECVSVCVWKWGSQAETEW